MTRYLSMILTALLLMCALCVPLSTAASGVTPTTTAPTTTTTTVWLCDSTTLPTTTTSTTLNLTGPDGTNPDNTSTVPTTTVTDPVPDCNSTPVSLTTTTIPHGAAEMLTNATVETTSSIGVLAGPKEGLGLYADCYSYDGGTLTVTPSNGGVYPFSSYRFLHITVRANTGFTITYFDDVSGISHDSEAVIAQALGNGSGWIPAGGYRIVLDLEELYVTLAEEEASDITVSRLFFTMQGPGSIAVGHIELSDKYTCTADIPNIQTTTKPSFPWDTTQGTDVTESTLPPVTSTMPETSTTGNQTTGDVLLPGDMDNDAGLTMTDAFLLYRGVSTGEWSGDQYFLADYDQDGFVDIRDAFALYRLVSGL